MTRRYHSALHIRFQDCPPLHPRFSAFPLISRYFPVPDTQWISFGFAVAAACNVCLLWYRLGPGAAYTAGLVRTEAVEPATGVENLELGKVDSREKERDIAVRVDQV